MNPQHLMAGPKASAIQQAVLGWPKIHECQDFVVPAALDPACLAVIPDTVGILCTIDPTRCAHITATESTMRKHRHQQHRDLLRDHAVRPDDGPPPPSAQGPRHLPFTEPVRYCRIFASSRDSHFILLERLGAWDEADPADPASPADPLTALVTQLRASLTARSVPAPEVQRLQYDDANPWLRRTGWSAYLAGQSLSDLRTSIQRPDADDPRPQAHIANALCSALHAAARASQQATAASGRMIRLEITRTEREKQPAKPLEAYLQFESLLRHCEPWENILLFFLRNGPHGHSSGPRFHFTPTQRRAWDQLYEAATQAPSVPPTQSPSPAPTPPGKPLPAHPLLPPLPQACLDFCVSLLLQNAAADEYECTLVDALAVLGLGASGWLTIDSYPPILSSVIKIARFMIVQKALQLHVPAATPREDEPAASLEDIIRQADREPELTPIRQIQHLVQRYLIRGTSSPMQWMIDLRTYGRSAFTQSTKPGHISWTGTDRLLYKQLNFTMSEFTTCVHQISADVRYRLVHHLLLQDPRGRSTIPAIPWDTLYDDPSNTAVQYSFLTHDTTVWPVDGRVWLFNQVTDLPTHRQRFFTVRRKELSPIATDQYLDRVVEFREQLAILIHLYAGQPARATELLSLRHRNTQAGGVRNLFIEDSLVALVSRYHKGYQFSNDVKLIHRYLPREVGELVVWYLWLVLPFADLLQTSRDARTQIPPKRERMDYLWPTDPNGGSWDDRRVRKHLQDATGKYLNGQVLNIHDYRDVTIGISRRYLQASSHFPNDKSQEEHDPDDMAKPNMNLDPDAWMSHILDLQAAHSSHIAGTTYGRSIDEQPGTTAHRRQLFRRSSTDWHRFLGFTSAVQSAGSKDPTAP
ncbi:unnamed protein product [Penicillium olsonii]|nr:unnamed protein product [Penicillium olsonii]